MSSSDNPELPDSFWERLFDAAREVHTPESVGALLVFLSFYFTIASLVPLGINAIPLLVFTVILASGAGGAVEELHQRNQERVQRSRRMVVLGRRLRAMYLDTFELPRSDGSPIREALRSAWTDYEAGLADSRTTSAELKRIGYHLAAAQREFHRRVEAGDHSMKQKNAVLGYSRNDAFLPDLEVYLGVDLSVQPTAGGNRGDTGRGEARFRSTDRSRRI